MISVLPLTIKIDNLVIAIARAGLRTNSKVLLLENTPPVFDKDNFNATSNHSWTIWEICRRCVEFGTAKWPCQSQGSILALKVELFKAAYSF
jgi:hypothetical protein